MLDNLKPTLGGCGHYHYSCYYYYYCRALFADAEAEEKKMGINSALHIIILDELDAICRQRGSLVSGVSLLLLLLL